MPSSLRFLMLRYCSLSHTTVQRKMPIFLAIIREFVGESVGV
jgi:hypothetical protein